MEAKQMLTTNSNGKGRIPGGLSRFGRPNRVTKEMTSAARIAVRKANEEAKKARLRAIRNRHQS